MAIIEDMIEGIRFLVEQVIKTAPYDKTDTAIVTGTTEFGYSISYNNQIYKDIKTTGGSCFVNETVRIVIPQNNMSNMFILKPPGLPESIRSIGNGEDLNNYRAVGRYYCAANAIAKTLINCPTSSGDGRAFSLDVEYLLRTNYYISQTLTAYNTGTRYFRTYDEYNKAWGVWYSYPPAP